MNYRQKKEQELGRKLTKDEIVHHADGLSHNDDSSNLVVVNGQKAHGLLHKTINIDWKQETIKLINQYTRPDLLELLPVLDVFFTQRQIHITLRKLLTKHLTKTEREYFSRTCKKKLKAIAHPALHKVASNLAWLIT